MFGAYQLPTLEPHGRYEPMANRYYYYYSNTQYAPPRTCMEERGWGRLPSLARPSGDKAPHLPDQEVYSSPYIGMVTPIGATSSSCENAQGAHVHPTAELLRRKRPMSASRRAWKSARKRAARGKRDGGLNDVVCDTEYWGRINPRRKKKDTNRARGYSKRNTCERQWGGRNEGNRATHTFVIWDIHPISPNRRHSRTIQKRR